MSSPFDPNYHAVPRGGYSEDQEEKEMNITKLPDGGKWFVKKPIPVKAVQMTEPFTCVTKEGEMSGKAGDYVIEGPFHDIYPCDRTIFENTYRKVKLTDKAAAEARKMFL